MGEYDDLIAHAASLPAAKPAASPAADDYADLIAHADTLPSSAAPLPRQTGKRFIEPPDDDLETASKVPYPKGTALAELRQQADALSPGAQLAQPFKDIGSGLLRANDFAARALRHPIDTLGKNPGATFREGMRGVNSNIPFANRAVEALGGPPAESPEDAAAAPGAQEFGSVAGLPVGNMIGGIAAKGVEAAAPVVRSAIKAVAAGAEERNVGRALENMEAKTYKRTRAGVRTGVVEDAVRENPALAKAAGNDAKLAEQAADLKTAAAAKLGKIYTKAAPLDDVAAPIASMDKRIAELQAGTSTDAEIARQLQVIRDEMNGRYGERGTTTAADLRAEQSAYQQKGYGKSLPGDDAATARIAANREASKAVGDAVVEHVTGLPYEAAKAAAEADPKGIAAQLFKANDQVNAALKIEAGIADRAGRVQPKSGVVGQLTHVATKLRHSPLGFGLSVVPTVAAAGVTTADRALARITNTIAAGVRPNAAMINEAVADGVRASTIYGLMNQRPVAEP